MNKLEPAALRSQGLCVVKYSINARPLYGCSADGFTAVYSALRTLASRAADTLPTREFRLLFLLFIQFIKSIAYASHRSLTAVPPQITCLNKNTVALTNCFSEQNFAQMRPYLGRTHDAATYEHIACYIRRFMAERVALIASRVRDGHIRDRHEDLRLQYVYIFPDDARRTSSIAILDGSEFNERFRYSDVASAVAFLTMELDATGRPDLARAFVASSVGASGDDVLRELLPFYTCSRACVRGKVTSFQLDEAEVPPSQRERAAAARGIRTIFVECVYPRGVALEHLAQCWQARLTGTQEAASRASDARPDLDATQASTWESYIPGEERDYEHVVVSTTQPLAASLEHVLDAIRG